MQYVETDGGAHTKVSFGGRQTTVPRHNEINEITARAILKHMGKGLQPLAEYRVVVSDTA